MREEMKKIVSCILAVLMAFVLLPMNLLVVNAEIPSSSTMNDFTTDVKVEGVALKDGSYTVLPGEKYTVDLTFEENVGKQFSDNQPLKYKFPSGFTPDTLDNGTMRIDLQDGDTVYPIEGNTYSVHHVQNGADDYYELVFNFNHEDDNYNKLANAINTSLTFTLNGTFNADSNDLNWGGSVTNNIKVNNDHNLRVDKTGYYSYGDNKIHYSLTVTSFGVNHNVIVKDTITGSALTYDDNASSSKGGTVEKSDKGFTYKFDSLGDNETVTINYTASVDTKKLNGFGNETDTANGVTVKSDEKPTESSASLNFNNGINYYSITKSGTTGTLDGDQQYLNWSVTYNEYRNASMKGNTITDTIQSDSINIMKYSGNATVTKIDKNGQTVGTETVTLNPDESSFKYGPITDEEIYEYVITYQTVVDLSQSLTNPIVKNDVGDGKVKTTGTVTVPLPEGKGIAVAKKGSISKDRTKTTWTVTLDVPKDGLTVAQVKDTLPMYIYQWDKDPYYDDLDGDFDHAIVIKGLDTNESYEISQTENSEKKHEVLINFYKDQAKTTTGLNSSDEKRQITIEITTINNPEWVKYTEENNNCNADHTNNVSFTGNDKTVNTSASVKPADKGYITKKSLNENQYSGLIGTLPYYDYEVVVGINDHTFDDDSKLEVEDFFDTNLLAYCSSRGLEVSYSDSQYWAGTGEKNRGTIEETATGVKFLIGKDEIPENILNTSNGHGYVYLRYSLQVKDEAALEEIKKLAAANTTDSTYIVKNAATYMGGKKETESKYTFLSFTKALVESASVLNPTSGPATMHYKLTINPSAYSLSQVESNPITFTDTHSDSLKINTDSITYKDNDGNSIANCKFDVDGNTLTFTVPNKTAVIIEYDATVTEQVHTKGELVTISNDAVLNGVKDTVENKATGIFVGGGVASIYSIELVKHEEGNGGKTLAGAVFQLYKGEPSEDTLIKDVHGDPVTVTTDNNGKAIIKGDYEQNGWYLTKNVKYYLQEINAPSGYALSNTPIEFTITDGSADRKNHIYTNNDTIYVSNTLTNEKGTLELTKTFAGENLSYDDMKDMTFTIYRAGEIVKTITYNDFVRSSDNKSGTYTWVDVPVGSYQVVESNAKKDGYSIQTTYNVDGKETSTVEISNNKTSTMNIKNTYSSSKGSLVIKKLISPTTLSLTDEQKKAMRFKIEGNGVNEIVTYFDFTDTTDGKQYTLKDLAPGSYTVTETTASINGYSLTTTYQVGEGSASSEPATVTVENGKESTVTVTNTYVEKGNLKITKTFAGDVNALSDAEKEKIEFKITGPNDFSKTVTYHDFGSDHTYTITDLTAGDYTVEETKATATGYTLTTTYKVNDSDSTTAKATVEDGKTSTIAVTNTYSKQVGSLVVKKTFAGSELTDAQKKAIKFTVTGTNYSKEVTYADFTNGSYTISNLPLGEYTVVESNAEVTGYTLTTTYKVNDSDSTTAKATVEDGKTATIEVINKYTKDAPKVGTLVVKKTFAGSELTDAQKKAIKFTVTGTNYSKEVTYADFTNGSYTISDLPLGEYTVVESNAEVTGYTLTTTYKVNDSDSTTAKATVEDAKTATIEVINKYTKDAPKVGTLVVKKTFAGSELTDAQKKAIKFTVTGTDYSKEVTYADFTNGSYTISNLPLGEYTVVESNAEVTGYTLTTTYKVNDSDSTTAKATVEDGKTSTIAVTNEYTKVTPKVGTLVVKKTFAGSELTDDQKKAIKFTVTGTDYSKEVTYAEFTDGSYTISNLPLGEYTVVESNAEVTGYSVVTKYEVSGSEKNKVTIEDKTTSEVEVTNTYTPIQLEVNKTDVVNSEELDGSTIALFPSKDVNEKGEVVEGATPLVQWTSIKGVTFNFGPYLSVGGQYVLSEIAAPDGYGLQQNIPFKVEETGVITITDSSLSHYDDGGKIVFKDDVTKVGFTKYDMSGKKFVEGAVLQVLDLSGNLIDEWTTNEETHVIEGVLSVDVTYVLHEASAPEGYTIAPDMNFVVSGDRKTGDEWNVIQEVVMKDDVTNVEVHKVNEEKQLLAGASLQIEDLNGNVLQQWTTNGEAYSVKQVLNINTTYKLVETKAPEGYDVATPIEFTIHDNGDVYIVKDNVETKVEANVLTMVDTKTPAVPYTGDHSQTILYIVIGVASLVALGLLILLKKKYKE